MPRKAKNLDQKLYDAKLQLLQLEEEYVTLLYFETMPDYDPMYKYCFSTSSMSIPFSLQSVDAWLRAVIKHMSLRKRGHGGAYTNALVVTIPDDLSNNGVDNWIAYVTSKLRSRAKSRNKLTAQNIQE